MPAVAMTDHGNMFGAVEFFQAAKKAGIKPILGCEVYMAFGSMKEKKASSARDASTHLTLLCRNNQGYQNLIKLVSMAYLEGFYYKPRIDHELLAKHAEGLICLSGCLNGEINRYILDGHMDLAEDLALKYKKLFGDDGFYLELHNHGIEQQVECNRGLLEISKKHNIPVVAANDVHFLERSHHEAHDVFICIGTGSLQQDEKRMHYSEELYFKSPEEMRDLFTDCPEAIENTLKIAELCNVEMEFYKTKYPEFPMPEGGERSTYLRELCEAGLRERYPDTVDTDPEISKRLEYELSVIERMGFVSYFLIVWDFIHFAKKNGIPVGPGRGSAAGSLVAYVLRITDVDPFKFGLIFERFLNPERVSPPDVDIDFCVMRRNEVIDYVRRKYGERAVSQIVTFNTLGAKNAVRDVARVLGWAYSDGDRVAKMIPNELNISLSKAVELNKELKAAIEQEPSTRQLWEYALLLEGLCRNTGVHAAGVVIGDRDLSEYIPLCKGKDDEVITQYAMGPLTDLGMLKMDFLGLKNLTVIEDAVRLINHHNPEFDLEKIPLEDQPCFDLLNRGETVGVFQLESGGMANLCKRFDINSIEDISALLALYRPGPMDLIDDYVERKRGRKKIKYEHPLLAEVCAGTYGIMIYQEQVQKAANLLAGFSLGEADLLRRAMGKKDKEKMALERAKFTKGCIETNQIEEDRANRIFDLLEKFAGYGFNKSHSAAYAIISYRTAYLKANYPVEFLCGLLSNEINNTDKISVLVNECKRMGIEILPPDVNRSGLKFRPEKTESGKAIRYGLAAIKNVGEGAMEAAVRDRASGGDFASLQDFCNRLDSRSVNKKVLESLVKCGAFDFTGHDRARLFASIDASLSFAASAHRDRATGQTSLFDLLDDTSGGDPVEEVVNFFPWTVEEKLQYEKELLGFYVTGHPLDAYREQFDQNKFVPIASLFEFDDKATVEVAGMVVSLDKKFSKKDGKAFAILNLEDLSGSVEVAVWSQTYEKVAERLQVGNVVIIQARLNKRDDRISLTANDANPLQQGGSQAPLVLYLHHEKTTSSELLEIREHLIKFPGHRTVEFHFILQNGKKVKMTPGSGFTIDLTDQLKRELSPWLVV